MRQNNFSRKKRQLKILAQKLQRLGMYGRVDAKAKVQKLIQKIKSLVQELAQVLSHAELKKILGAAAFLIGISIPNKSNAQSFAAPIVSPFGMVSTTYYASPAFAELDGDGDSDLLVGEYTASTLLV